MALLRMLFVTLLFSQFALAQTPGKVDPDNVESEKLRREIGGQIQLVAANLLDELVYTWIQTPPFDVETNVVLAGISVPLGLGTGLTAFLENHYYQLVSRNPRSHVRAVYCPACNAVLINANPNGTLMSRGVDAPEVLKSTGLNSNAKYALHLDFEAEGSTLVLRAIITSLDSEHVIVWARTYSSATTAGAMLRSDSNLVSASDARQEYLNLLQGHDRFEFPVRIIYRSYKEQDYYYYSFVNGQSSTTSPVTAPFLWLELGAEMSFTQNRVWGGGVSVGYTALHQTHEGFSFGARVHRLISGEARSLLHPDLYFFTGITAIQIKGLNVVNFRKDPLPYVDLLAKPSDDPKATFAAWKLGLETRMKNRFSAAAFLETMPAINKNFGTYLETGLITFPAYGVEVGLWF